MQMQKILPRITAKPSLHPKKDAESFIWSAET